MQHPRGPNMDQHIRGGNARSSTISQARPAGLEPATRGLEEHHDHEGFREVNLSRSPRVAHAAIEALRLVADGQDEGAVRALEVVEEVLKLEPLVVLAREAAKGGPLQVARALRLCERVVEVLRAPVAEGDALQTAS